MARNIWNVHIKITDFRLLCRMHLVNYHTLNLFVVLIHIHKNIITIHSFTNLLFITCVQILAFKKISIISIGGGESDPINYIRKPDCSNLGGNVYRYCCLYGVTGQINMISLPRVK